jgi:hypothetical protein
MIKLKNCWVGIKQQSLAHKADHRGEQEIQTFGQCQVGHSDK